MKASKIRSKSARPAASRGSLLVFLTILSMSAWQPAAAQPTTPDLFLDGDLTGAGELRIGGDLDVTLSDGEPHHSYTVLLVDEADARVASADLMTDAAGKTVSHRLWTRTGVVGCDPEAVHDPASYQFESFAEAESALDSRKFRVVVVDDPDAFPGSELVSAELPMVVVTPPVEAYPSDRKGCLRTVLNPGQPVYLAISHQGAGALTFRIFVVEFQETWAAGDPLVDVRPGGSQVISVPAGADPAIEPLWKSVGPGRYQIIVRRGTVDEPSFDVDIDTPCPYSFGGSHNKECDPCP